MSDTEQPIRERAYHLWNDAGRPDGQCDAFWLSAQREMLSASIEPMPERVPGAAVTSPKSRPPAKSKPKSKSLRRKAA